MSRPSRRRAIVATTTLLTLLTALSSAPSTAAQAASSNVAQAAPSTAAQAASSTAAQAASSNAAQAASSTVAQAGPSNVVQAGPSYAGSVAADQDRPAAAPPADVPSGVVLAPPGPHAPGAPPHGHGPAEPAPATDNPQGRAEVAAPPATSGFEKVKLDGGLTMGEPIELAVLPDGKVLYINRGTSAGGGQVRLYNPATQSTTVALTLSLDARFEDGLIGITLHPGFAANRWVYLFYSPKVTPLVNRISRFTFDPATGLLAPGSEDTLIEWPTERSLCCHSAGSMSWDSAGNLYFAVGDNTNSGGDSAGMAPIDERTDRNPQYDAQRTSGNTNDLRGKINRIRPQDDGSYTIPAGNLFPVGTAKTRPEIYVMGLRNPYRIWVDKKANNTLYWGEVGPDAGADVANRGPAAYDEFNRATGPGNFGWPYCGGPNVAYNDWDFAARAPRGWFPCGGTTGPVNDSPRNTGLNQLPPTKPALVWEQHGGSEDWPALDNPGGCGSPNHTEVYHYDPNLVSDVKWPPYYDNKWIIAEYCRNWIKEVQFDNGNPATGRPTLIEPVLGGMSFVHPIDWQFGPDGSMYLLEYGSGYFSGAPDAGLYKINYAQSGRSPSAKASVNRDNGLAPLAVSFSSAGSVDPDGDPLTYAWDFTNNGSTDSTAANPSFTYTANGSFQARLTVNDGTGRSATTLVPIVVGNNRPTLTVTSLPAGGTFDWGDDFTVTATATDPQDGPIDCAKVIVRVALGHQEHAHEEGEGTGCGATFNTGPVHAGPDSVLFFVIRASYTDTGAPGSAPLTGEKEIILWPKQWQAEHYVQLGGPAVIDQPAAEGGKRLGDIQNGEYVKHHPVSLKGITGVRARVSSGGAGGTVSFRYDSPTGPEVARVTVPNTGGWDNYTEISAPVSKPDDGTHDLYLVVTGGGGALLDLDSYTFTGPGIGTGGGPRIGEIRGLGKCVDIAASGTVNGTKVQLYDCNGTAAQRWTVGTDGTVRGLGRCLDVKSSGTTNGTPVQLWECNGSGAQQWARQADGSLRNPQSGRCLDIPASNVTNGTQLQIHDCNGTGAQRWTLP